MEGAAPKRRSLLVQPGTFSGSLSRSTHEDVNTNTEAPARQLGGLRRTQSIRAPAPSRGAIVDDIVTPSSTAPSALRRANSTKPARPMSMMAPPPSRLQTSSLASSTGMTSSLRPAHGRQLGHARTQSFQSVQEHPSDGSTPTPQHARAPSTASNSPTKMPMLRPATRHIPSVRPEFNMNQQHFSPKKNFAPKPASMSLVNAPAKPTGLMADISTEMQSLQTQLLQLEILHDAFRKSLREWNASAEAKLRDRFLDTAARQEQIELLEREVQIRDNVAALQAWGVKGEDAATRATAAPEADEYVQILCSVVIETSRLSMADGRIEVANRDIEQWMTQAEEIWSSRQATIPGQATTSPTYSNIGFMEDLRTHWTDEIPSLQRRLMALRSDLELLPPAAEGSSLQRVVSGFKALIRLVQENLGIVVEVREVMERAEKEWIEKEARALVMGEA